jgi:putative ABC transport system ATP-binding protein
VAVGEHRELVIGEPRYRAVVTRETDEEAALRGALDEERVEQAVLHGEETAAVRGPAARGVLEEIEETA